MDILAAKINYISSLRPYNQIGLGAVSGWLTGFLVMKIGKFATAILGGALIIIKIAEVEGLVKIDWLKVKENVQNVSIKPYTTFTLDNAEQMVSNVENFLISFVGGSLIGIGFS